MFTVDQLRAGLAQAGLPEPILDAMTEIKDRLHRIAETRCPLGARTAQGRALIAQDQARSNTAAIPWPPPMHMVSSA
ncbi:hypothetical protein OKW42_000126 [Paraburkholderia sp. WC7.3d]